MEFRRVLLRSQGSRWQDGTGSAGKAVLPSGGCAFVIVEVRWQPSYCAAPMPRSCFLASRKSRASSPAPKGRPFLRCLPSCRSEEHTSELQSLMRISYAVFCLKKKKQTTQTMQHHKHTSSKLTHTVNTRT